MMVAKKKAVRKERFFFSAAVAMETPPDLLLPWQQWRKRGRLPANQNWRRSQCCITSGGGRAGNTPTVSRLGFTVAVRQSTLPPAGPECQTVVICTGFKGRPRSPSGQSQTERQIACKKCHPIIIINRPANGGKLQLPWDWNRQPFL